MIKLDAVDKKLLEMLQQDSKVSVNELSKKLKEYFPLYDIYDVIKTYKTHIWIGGIANNYNAPSYLDKIKAYSISKIADMINKNLESVKAEIYKSQVPKIKKYAELVANRNGKILEKLKLNNNNQQV